MIKIDKRSRAITKTIAILVTVVIIAGLMLGIFGYYSILTPAQNTIMLEKAPIKINIEARVDGLVIHYREELFWSEDHFSEILAKPEFSPSLIRSFKENLSKYGEGREYVTDVEVEFDEAKRSTTLGCDAHGAVSRSDGSYHATFFWLLEPLRLDFINDQFNHPEKGLYWKGYVKGIPTEVLVELPVSVEAWGHPNGHCHAHVWWEEG